MNPADLIPLLVQQMPQALVFADTAGVIRFWNPAAERLFGFAAEAALGQSLDLIIPEKLRAAHWRGYALAIQNAAAHDTGPPRLTRARHQSGASIHAEMSFCVIVDGQGRALGALAVAQAPKTPPAA